MVVVRTERDAQLLEALGFKVGLLSLEQVAAAWWGGSSDPERFARRRLRQLEGDGVLERHEVTARPLLPLARALAEWVPGQPVPDAEAVSHAAQSRWHDAPRRTVVYLASAAVLRELGAPRVALPKLGQETHDLHMGALYLRALKEDPQRASAWVGEGVFRASRRRQKLPDAMLMEPALRVGEGQATLAIDFVGAYSAARIAAFHQDCARRELAYELW